MTPPKPLHPLAVPVVMLLLTIVLSLVGVVAKSQQTDLANLSVKEQENRERILVIETNYAHILDQLHAIELDMKAHRDAVEGKKLEGNR